MDDFINKTVKELRELAKTRKIRGYSKMLKADLVQALKPAQPSGQVYTFEQLMKKSVKDLKDIAKTVLVKGYYKLNKDPLVKAILATYVSGEATDIHEIGNISEVVEVAELPRTVDYSKMKVAELKDIVRKMGIQGYYKLNKKELIQAISRSPVLADISNVVQTDAVDVEYSNMKVAELKDLAKKMGIRGYYKLNKGELVQAIVSARAPKKNYLDDENVYVDVVNERNEDQVVYTEPDVVHVSPAVDMEEHREAYIDDILTEIQMPNVDKYLRGVSEKVLQCLGMY